MLYALLLVQEIRVEFSLLNPVTYVFNDGSHLLSPPVTHWFHLCAYGRQPSKLRLFPNEAINRETGS